jgi:hypothetical protein
MNTRELNLENEIPNLYRHVIEKCINESYTPISISEYIKQYLNDSKDIKKMIYEFELETLVNMIQNQISAIADPKLPYKKCFCIDATSARTFYSVFDYLPIRIEAFESLIKLDQDLSDLVCSIQDHSEKENKSFKELVKIKMPYTIEEILDYITDHEIFNHFSVPSEINWILNPGNHEFINQSIEYLYDHQYDEEEDE